MPTDIIDSRRTGILCQPATSDKCAQDELAEIGNLLSKTAQRLDDAITRLQGPNELTEGKLSPPRRGGLLGQVDDLKTLSEICLNRADELASRL